MTTVYNFKAGYTKAGIATAPSSAPTITVVDSANNILVAALTATTAIANLVGTYIYSYSGADNLDLIGLFHTSDATMDQQDLFGYTPSQTYNIKAQTDKLAFTVTNQVDSNVLDWKSATAPAMTGDAYAVANGRLPAALTANGNIKSSLVEILTTALTETAGYLSAGFKKFFNIASPVMTVAGVDQAANNDTKLTTIQADVENVTYGLSALLTAINNTSAADAAAIWNYLLTSIATPNSIGKLLKDDIDATVSSRATPASPVASTAALVSGTTITVLRGDSMSLSFTALGSLANISKLYFTAKVSAEDTDANAVIQIENAGGLLILNKAVAATPADGTLTVTNPTTGALTVTLVAADVATLSLGSLLYDVQIVRSAGTAVSTLTSGKLIVSGDATRATA